jgi:hypothetical protein
MTRYASNTLGIERWREEVSDVRKRPRSVKEATEKKGGQLHNTRGLIISMLRRTYPDTSG